MTLNNSRKVKRIYISVITIFMLSMFLMPLFYGISGSLKSKEQLSSLNHSPIPQSPKKVKIGGKECEVLMVPQADGTKKALAIVKKGRDESVFVDPENVAGGQIKWNGKWRTLENDWELNLQFSNYKKGWKSINFLLLFRNTLFYALITTFGTLLSSTFVAYGFSRFNFRAKGKLFIILIANVL